MTSHGLDTVSRIAIRASGVLMVGVLLASCGQQAQQAAGPAPAVQAGPAPSVPAPASSSESTAGTAPPSRSAAHPRKPSTQASTPTTEASRQSTTVERCHTSMLTGSLRQGHPAAGQRYAELTLHNGSDRVCTIHGYPGLQLVDSNGHPLATDVHRIPRQEPEPIRLSSGESVSATLHWGVVPTGEEPVSGPCGPEPAGIEVIPPDEREPLTVAWTLGPVCGNGSLDTTALH
ncbi:DUF4232 domain-containing protein [Haloactinomyces albus]|uniref:DUF4232 domain-containing protein n=1 Tax=Haloactinomyces albus TaxID=1352928 RepID=A0AAE3ZCP9_9ACTN|nr:DUF4232 domain-containing protein [Haloactinomyces albus]MDR7301455.1 hypothetical protein [Haloactinomyces albus]